MALEHEVKSKDYIGGKEKCVRGKERDEVHYLRVCFRYVWTQGNKYVRIEVCFVEPKDVVRDKPESEEGDYK